MNVCLLPKFMLSNLLHGARVLKFMSGSSVVFDCHLLLLLICIISIHNRVIMCMAKLNEPRNFMQM